nr:cell division protein [Borodinellopsis texensis]
MLTFSLISRNKVILKKHQNFGQNFCCGSLYTVLFNGTFFHFYGKNFSNFSIKNVRFKRGYTVSKGFLQVPGEPNKFSTEGTSGKKFYSGELCNGVKFPILSKKYLYLQFLLYQYTAKNLNKESNSLSTTPSVKNSSPYKFLTVPFYKAKNINIADSPNFEANYKQLKNALFLYSINKNNKSSFFSTKSGASPYVNLNKLHLINKNLLKQFNKKSTSKFSSSFATFSSFEEQSSPKKSLDPLLSVPKKRNNFSIFSNLINYKSFNYSQEEHHEVPSFSFANVVPHVVPNINKFSQTNNVLKGPVFEITQQLQSFFGGGFLSLYDSRGNYNSEEYSENFISEAKRNQNSSDSKKIPFLKRSLVGVASQNQSFFSLGHTHTNPHSLYSGKSFLCYWFLPFLGFVSCIVFQNVTKNKGALIDLNNNITLSVPNSNINFFTNAEILSGKPNTFTSSAADKKKFFVSAEKKSNNHQNLFVPLYQYQIVPPYNLLNNCLKKQMLLFGQTYYSYLKQLENSYTNLPNEQSFLQVSNTEGTSGKAFNSINTKYREVRDLFLPYKNLYYSGTDVLWETPLANQNFDSVLFNKELLVNKLNIVLRNFHKTQVFLPSNSNINKITSLTNTGVSKIPNVNNFNCKTFRNVQKFNLENQKFLLASLNKFSNPYYNRLLLSSHTKSVNFSGVKKKSNGTGSPSHSGGLRNLNFTVQNLYGEQNKLTSNSFNYAKRIFLFDLKTQKSNAPENSRKHCSDGSPQVSPKKIFWVPSVNFLKRSGGPKNIYWTPQKNYLASLPLLASVPKVPFFMGNNFSSLSLYTEGTSDNNFYSERQRYDISQSPNFVKKIFSEAKKDTNPLLSYQKASALLDSYNLKKLIFNEVTRTELAKLREETPYPFLYIGNLGTPVFLASLITESPTELITQNLGNSTFEQNLPPYNLNFFSEAKRTAKNFNGALFFLNFQKSFNDLNREFLLKFFNKCNTEDAVNNKQSLNETGAKLYKKLYRPEKFLGFQKTLDSTNTKLNVQLNSKTLKNTQLAMLREGRPKVPVYKAENILGPPLLASPTPFSELRSKNQLNKHELYNFIFHSLKDSLKRKKNSIKKQSYQSLNHNYVAPHSKNNYGIPLFTTGAFGKNFYSQFYKLNNKISVYNQNNHGISHPNFDFLEVPRFLGPENFRRTQFPLAKLKEHSLPLETLFPIKIKIKKGTKKYGSEAKRGPLPHEIVDKNLKIEKPIYNVGYSVVPSLSVANKQKFVNILTPNFTYLNLKERKTENFKFPVSLNNGSKILTGHNKLKNFFSTGDSVLNLKRIFNINTFGSKNGLNLNKKATPHSLLNSNQTKFGVKYFNFLSIKVQKYFNLTQIISKESTYKSKPKRLFTQKDTILKIPFRSLSFAALNNTEKIFRSFLSKKKSTLIKSPEKFLYASQTDSGQKQLDLKNSFGLLPKNRNFAISSYNLNFSNLKNEHSNGRLRSLSFANKNNELRFPFINSRVSHNRIVFKNHTKLFLSNIQELIDKKLNTQKNNSSNFLHNGIRLKNTLSHSLRLNKNYGLAKLREETQKDASLSFAKKILRSLQYKNKKIVGLASLNKNLYIKKNSPTLLIKNRAFLLKNSLKEDIDFSNKFHNGVLKDYFGLGENPKILENHNMVPSLSFHNIKKGTPLCEPFFIWDKEYLRTHKLAKKKELWSNFNYIEKKKFLQKKRRKKKQKKETRRRKKRQRFFPRPIWTRFQLYKKFLNLRWGSFANKDFNFILAPQNKFEFSSANGISHKKIFSIPYRKNNRNNYLSPYKFFSEAKRTVPFYKPNKNNFAEGTIKNLYSGNSSMLYRNKEFYKISRSVLGDLKRVFWKSYWLRSNLNPYLKKVKIYLNDIRKSETNWQLSENSKRIRQSILGLRNGKLHRQPLLASQKNFSPFFIKNVQSFPHNSIYKNPKTLENAFFFNKNFNKWQQARNMSEYNRIMYERLQQLISNIRENLSLNGENKNNSYHLGHKKLPFLKHNLFRTQSPTNNFLWSLVTKQNKDFWTRFAKTITLENTLPPKIYYGDISILRQFWAINKTNLGAFKQKNKRYDLWIKQKLRDQSQSNKTKKILQQIFSKINDFVTEPKVSTLPSAFSENSVKPSVSKNSTEGTSGKGDFVLSSIFFLGQNNIKIPLGIAEKKVRQKEEKLRFNLNSPYIMFNREPLYGVPHFKSSRVLLNENFQKNSTILLNKKNNLNNVTSRFSLASLTEGASGKKFSLSFANLGPGKFRQYYSSNYQYKNHYEKIYLRQIKKQLQLQKNNNGRFRTQNYLKNRANFFNFNNDSELCQFSQYAISSPKKYTNNFNYWWSYKSALPNFQNSVYPVYTKNKKEQFLKSTPIKFNFLNFTEQNLSVSNFWACTLLLHFCTLLTLLSFSQIRGLLKFHFIFISKISKVYVQTIESFYKSIYNFYLNLLFQKNYAFTYIKKLFKKDAYYINNIPLSLYTEGTFFYGNELSLKKSPYLIEHNKKNQRKTFFTNKYSNIYNNKGRKNFSYLSSATVLVDGTFFYGKKFLSFMPNLKINFKKLYWPLFSNKSKERSSPERSSPDGISYAAPLSLSIASEGTFFYGKKVFKKQQTKRSSPKWVMPLNFSTIKNPGYFTKIISNNLNSNFVNNNVFNGTPQINGGLRQKFSLSFANLKKGIRSLPPREISTNLLTSLKIFAEGTSGGKHSTNELMYFFFKYSFLKTKYLFGRPTKFFAKGISGGRFFSGILGDSRPLSFHNNGVSSLSFAKKFLLVDKTNNLKSNSENSVTIEKFQNSTVYESDPKELSKLLTMKLKKFQTLQIVFGISITNFLFSSFYKSCYISSNYLLKSFDILENFTSLIYKFFEKPGELIVDWIAFVFLVEWSADLTNTIPETIDMGIWNSFNKFSRFTKISGLAFGEINNTSLLNINSTGSLPLYTSKSPLFLSFSLFLGTLIQRRIWNMYDIFVYNLCQPDTDLLVRQKKGLIFWDIWTDYVIEITEDSNINISELTSIKEQQDSFFEKIAYSNSFSKDVEKITKNNKILPVLFFSKNFLSRRLRSYKTTLTSQTLLDQITKADQNIVKKTGKKRAPLHGPQRSPRISELGHNYVDRIINGSGELNHTSSSLFNNWSSEDQLQKGAKKNVSENGIFSPSFANINKGGLRSLSFNTDLISLYGYKNFWKRWSTNQFLSYQGKDSDLFIDVHPPKCFSQISFFSKKSGIPNSYNMEQPIGNMVCQIFSGIFYKQTAKNMLVVGSSGIEKTLLIQAIAGETELKIITDNAHRYAMVYRGVAVGIKLLRDVFDALALHSPCLFLMEDIHLIGERRPFLISDDENTKSTQSSMGAYSSFINEEIHEKNKVIYQLSKHFVSHYKKPYKGDFSLLIPTNHFCFDLFLGESSFRARRNNITPTNPLLLDLKKDMQQNLDKVDTDSENRNISKKPIFSSSLQINNGRGRQSNQLLSPPATSPFSVLILKEEKKFKPKKVVKQVPLFLSGTSWEISSSQSTSGEMDVSISKPNYSIRAKVAMLAEMALSNLSVKLDMITDLLVIIDSVKSNRGFVVFATTHVPYVLDPALRRPGRLDETISLPVITTLLNRWEVLKSNFGTFFSKSFSSGSSKGTTLDFINTSIIFNNTFSTSTIYKGLHNKFFLLYNINNKNLLPNYWHNTQQSCPNKRSEEFVRPIMNFHYIKNRISTKFNNFLEISPNNALGNINSFNIEGEFVNSMANINIMEPFLHQIKNSSSINDFKEDKNIITYADSLNNLATSLTGGSFAYLVQYMLNSYIQNFKNNTEKNDLSSNNQRLANTKNAPKAPIKNAHNLFAEDTVKKLYGGKDSKKIFISGANKLTSKTYSLASKNLISNSLARNKETLQYNNKELFNNKIDGVLRSLNFASAKNSINSQQSSAKSFSKGDSISRAKIKNKQNIFHGDIRNDFVYNSGNNSKHSIYLILYSSPSILKNHLINLIAGKLGELFAYSIFSINQTSARSSATNLTKTSVRGLRQVLAPNLFSEAKKNHNFEWWKTTLSNPYNFKSLNNFLTLFGVDETWRSATSLLLSFLQKRYLYNKNSTRNVTSLLYLMRTDSLHDAPSPPATTILLPAKRYENYKRAFKNQQIKRQAYFSIMEKIQLHQQQRLVKRLYKLPIKEYFRSEIVMSHNNKSAKNGVTSFGNSSIVLGPLDPSVEKISSMNWHYRNKVLNRHRNYLNNQWWNAQLPEHNSETTFLSDIDWRYTFVDSVGDILMDYPDADQHYNTRERKFNRETNFYWPNKNNKSNQRQIKNSSLNLYTEGNFSYGKEIFNDKKKMVGLASLNSFGSPQPNQTEFDIKEIYYMYIFDCFIRAYAYLEKNREILDFYAVTFLQNGVNQDLKEIQTFQILKRFNSLNMSKIN